MSVMAARGSRALAAIAAAGILALTGVILNGASAVTPSSGPTSGQTLVSGDVPIGATFISVSAGHDHSLGLGVDGYVYAWGGNGLGQLGDGTTTDSSVPVKVQTPDGVTFAAVVAGRFGSAAVSTDGDVYTWGLNNYGQLGNGTTTNSSVPVKALLPDGVTITEVAAGYFHVVALASDGSVYSWGSNSLGQLGNGTTTASSSPTLAQSISGVTFTQVLAAGYHTVARSSDGLVYSWGDNRSNQLGDGTVTNSSVPVAPLLPDGVTVSVVSTGYDFSVVMASDGNLYAWGANGHRQLGNDSTVNASAPTVVQLPDGVTFTSLFSGEYHTLALGSDGNSYAWGWNVYGQVGIDSAATDVGSPTLIQSPDGVTFTTGSAGFQHTLAMGSDGYLYAWGANSNGELGDGSMADSAVPVLAVVDEVTVTSVEFGGVAGTELSQDVDAGTWSALTPAHACGTVDVAVTASHSFGSLGTVTLADGTFTFGSAVVVTGQPVASTSLPAGGGEVTLNAAAEGDEAPSVQWQESVPGSGEWSDIAGATETTLTTTVTEDTDVRAVFTNCLGTATTDVAAVTVAAVEPSQTPTPTAEPSASVSPTVPPADGSGSSGGGLALTGAGVVGVLLAGLVAVSAGAVLRRASQKKS